MSENDLSVGRPSVNVPLATEQVAAQTIRTKRTGKTTGTATDNLTVERESASPQYGVNRVAGGPELSPPGYINASDLMTILLGLRQKHTESSIESAEQRIHDRSVSKELKSKEMIKKLQKVANKSPVGGILAKIFAWVGVALSFIVAGVIGFVSGGAAAAPLLIIATVSAALLIAQQSGLMEKTMDAMHMDDKAKMGLSLGITALMLVINIVAVVASGGASAVGVAAKAAETATEVAAATGEVAAEAGASVAETAAEVSTSVAEAAVEASTKATEAIADAATEATEAAVEASTKATEAIADAATEATEAAVEASTKATEAIADAATEATESAVETAANVAESAAEEAGQAAQTAAKAPTAAVKAVAQKLGTTSGRVMKIAGQVTSGIKVAEGVSQAAIGGVSIGNAAEGYKATETRASAMRDKAILTKMQALDEEDVRRLRDMIQQLENAQNAVMSTITQSDAVALQIRQNI